MSDTYAISRLIGGDLGRQRDIQEYAAETARAGQISNSLVDVARAAAIPAATDLARLGAFETAGMPAAEAGLRRDELNAQGPLRQAQARSLDAGASGQNRQTRLGLSGGVMPGYGGFGVVDPLRPRGLAKGTERVPGTGDGTVDKVPAKLAPGEAVLNKAAAEFLGRGMIKKLNAMGAHKMGMA